MEKLELKQYDVQEMDTMEIINTNGGSKGAWYIFVYDAVSDYLKGVGEGYKWASKHLN